MPFFYGLRIVVTPQSLIEKYIPLFPDADTARLDAEILTAAGLEKSRSWLRAFVDDPLQPEQIDAVEKLLLRRQLGEPVAYILGEWEFYSLRLKVNPFTLIPRPETEQMVDWVIQKADQQASQTVLDLGTGTGAIAIALKHERPQLDVHAVEFSADALEVAKSNAHLHQADICFYHGSWFTPIQQTQRFDIIVSNPPYVANDDPHMTQGDLRFEPTTALTAGNDEFSDIRTIIESAPKFLTSKGWLVIEHGYDQSAVVQELLQDKGFQQVHTEKDYAGTPRFTYGQLSPKACPNSEQKKVD